MPLRPPAGFISAFFDPLKNPDAPTAATATGGDASASVAFTAPSNVGGSAITAYYAVSDPSQVTVSGATSPITVTGLSNGTAYTFSVWALNSYGPSAFSAATGSATPVLARGLFSGGISASGNTNTIDYISIASTGNATTFGQLVTSSSQSGACSSSTRGVFGGGYYGPGWYSAINYVTLASTGNTTSFGTLSQGIGGLAACSNSNGGVQ